MLTLRHYLRPFKTIRLLVNLADTRAKHIEMLTKCLEMTRSIGEKQAALLALREAIIERLKSERDLLTADTVVTVDQATRDGIEPPTSKPPYIN